MVREWGTSAPQNRMLIGVVWYPGGVAYSPPRADLPEAVSGNPLDLLSPRSLIVFGMRSSGRGMAEIARALCISRETAYQHLHRARAILSRVAAGQIKVVAYRLCTRCHQGAALPRRSWCPDCWRDYHRAYMRQWRREVRVATVRLRPWRAPGESDDPAED